VSKARVLRESSGGGGTGHDEEALEVEARGLAGARLVAAVDRLQELRERVLLGQHA